MTPILYIGNKNYSSWSLRPWLALTWSGIDFEARVIPLGGPGYLERLVPGVLAVSETGTVPVLHLGETRIQDSLAISEWAAEKAPQLWPEEPLARALARAATCEMHSSFAALRAALPCNIRRRAAPRPLDAAVRRDVERVQALWRDLRARFGSGGPYLFGAEPSIADAFFTPVAARFRTYAVPLASEAARYVDAVLDNPAFRSWEAEAVKEPLTIPHWDAF